MKTILVVLTKGHNRLYHAGFKNYEKENNVRFEFFIVDNPMNFYNTSINKYIIKHTFFLKDKFYKTLRKEFLKRMDECDEILFINLYFDGEYFIDSALSKSVYRKTCKILFVDSIKTLPVPFMYWTIFDEVWSFEFTDICYCKNKFGLKVNYAFIGTNYNIYKEDVDKIEYDICFVGISDPKRIEYLEKITDMCEKEDLKLFIAGHFWHSSGVWNSFISKMKFQRKHPRLAKHILNVFIEPAKLKQIYLKSKICINVNVEHHNGFNPRNFDIMSTNRLLISDMENMQGIDLIPNEDFVMCIDSEDMTKKILFFLRNDDLRKQISYNGYNKVSNKYLFNNTLDLIYKVGALT